MFFAKMHLRRLVRLIFGSFAVASVAAAAPAQTFVSFPGTTPVGQSSQAVSVLLTATVSGVSPGPVAVTQGLQNADYVLAPGGTCPTTSATFAAHQSCTLNVVFQPTSPGLRSGAVVLRAADGTLLGSTALSGVATGPLPVLSPGLINTVAGETDYIYQGDGVPATQAPIFLPGGVVLDGAGNLYLSDTLNNRVRRVDAKTGLISTIAGTGIAGFSGDGGPGTQALVSSPGGLAVDGLGALYIADTGNHAIRRIDPVTGIITTVAGQLGQQGYTGDGAAATSARLTSPEGVSFDLAANLIVTDTGNNVVRQVDAATGLIHTIVGTGVAGYNGDGQQATSAQLQTPWTATVGLDGSLYVSDRDNHRIRQVSATGVIATVAGTGSQDFTGDGGPATQAALNEPSAVVLDPAGDLFIADTGNNRIRMVSAANSQIATIAGTGDESFSGDAGPANLAVIYGTNALFLDGAGNLYLTDPFHNRIRAISALTANLNYATIRVGKLSPSQIEAVLNEGNANLDATSFALTNAALDPTSTCAVGVPVPSAGSCNLAAIFAPTTVGSPIDGSITIASDAVTVPVITLIGDVLNVNPTTVTLTSNVNPSQTGQAVTFTVVVASSNTALTGTVTFTDGTTQLCSVAIGAGNTAKCVTSTLSLGQHSIAASYTGDAQDASGTSPTLLQAVKQLPTLVLTVTTNPAVVNAGITLTCTATAPVGTPTGAITFYDGTTQLGSASLSGGTASFSTSQLAVGTHNLLARYAGDATDSQGVSNILSEVIQQATTATTLASSNASPSVGSSVTLTATVAYVSGVSGTALTGTVQFNDGTTSLGSVPLANGTAALTTSTLAPGPHNITAVYSGDTDDNGSQSSTLVEAVQQIATTTQLAADINPLAVGSTVHFTATVSGATAAAGALAGNVTFTDGSVTLGTAALNATGQAVFATNALANGSHAIVATFVGSTNYAGSTSNTLVEVVQQTSTVTALSTAATPTEAGTPATWLALVTSQTGVPTGSVRFTDNGVTIGTVALNAQGLAILATSTLSVGTHQMVAVYGGDGNYVTSTSAAVPQVVVPAATATALTGSLNPAPLGQPVTFTASITSKSAIVPGGTINFTDGATSLGSVVVAANGTASFTTNSLAFGSHLIFATYSGDTNHGGSSSSALSEQIVQVATALLTSSPNPSITGNNVLFTAKIVGVGSVIPTGSVTLTDGATNLAVLTLDATGAASLQTATLPVGSHPIKATYSGDTNYAAASASLIQTVQSATTQATVTASANPATYATALTLTATITSLGGVATGSVAFTDGGTTLGTAPLNASGVATLTTAALAPGMHLIVVTYAGDGQANASASPPLSLVVKQLTQAVVTSSANPTLTLSPLVLTATVTNSGVGVATGTVTFSDGPASLGTATLNASGIATLTVPQLSAGSHSIAAAYAGDGANFATSSPATLQTVTLRPTGTKVSGQSIDPTNPQNVLLIGVVQWTGPTAPTGSIAFSSNGNVLGTAAINTSGVATLAVTLSPGTNMVTATYAGDLSYASSISETTSISGGPTTHFSMTLNPASMSMQSQQHGTTSLTLTSVAGFTDTMSFGCLGLPFAATCTFSKTQAPLPANGTATVQLTIDTGSPLGAGSQVMLRPRASNVLLCLLPFGALLGFGLSRRKKLLPLLLLACAITLTLSATGCGGLQINGTPAGTYTLDVTAEGQTGVLQSQTFTLTVTP